ncbi:type II toxin-antitoxin system VapC family toxin [Williamsia sp. 1135]|uniref:type II toxin-antitoxin system VapC family toxin n=1 Tax=Williamsia sp. 1135 TaxID=1889262 RepID=UPI000A102D78|nr:type II toxin-antitoxin system VapC family toxin [Williamsia sp. 1135]ORM38049.1 VapC toxin family PIN domain ribonuclease [Williamsia sp. 1135]
MIVVDASVLITALAEDSEDGRHVRSRLVRDKLVAPQIVDLEVMSVLRRSVRTGRMSQQRAASAVADLIDLPFERSDHRPLLGRCWQLHENLTTYDAAYVALAELLDVPLLTADVSLARAPGIRCAVEVLTPPAS